MKKFFYEQMRFILSLLIIALMITGCNKNETPEDIKPEKVEVKLSYDIGKQEGILTPTMANNQWQNGDEIGFSMISSSDRWEFFARNVKLTPSGGNLVAASPIHYPDSCEVDFYAYYPYEYSFLGDHYGDTLEIHLSNQSSGLPYDVLYSNNVKNQSATTATVQLVFNYTLAKLMIAVNAGNTAFTAQDMANMQVTIEGVATSGYMYPYSSYGGQEWYGHEPPGTITTHKIASSSTYSAFEALVFPVTVTNENDIKIVFHIAGERYVYNVPVGTVYDAAHIHRLVFTLYDPHIAVMTNSYIVPREEAVKYITFEIP
jgi:hypothetical protein